ncbi:nitric oxide-sensing protein NosP [Oceanospirillum linum]|uniref:nitric oxide-sensing protein NosP n=1 Tax=Oceanospirillum linum TaxID=966 RepID=UPI00089E211E|nr:nitric oxide-sensing protein NosP [Oceanospirillum linum]SEG12280.1 Uncharacterized conserved protein, contains FIST_N domain [Oleiphilus messinensis]SMP09520.1 Uncharacterized conserved protein, contains FIST_N domain [Oceanospirillum linum]
MSKKLDGKVTTPSQGGSLPEIGSALSVLTQAVTAVSHLQEAAECAAELQQTFGNTQLKWVLFFCSAQLDVEALATELECLMPDKTIIGCTSAGELSPAGYCQRSVTAVAFPEAAFHIETALIEHLDQFDFTKAQQQVSHMLERCQLKQKAPLKGHTFLLTLLDGMSDHEEVVLNILNAVLGSTPMLGGSAGDDLDFSHTQVVYQGKSYQNAAVLMLVNTACPFMVFSQKHVEDTDELFVATKVDSEHRRVYELNAQPAAEVYANAIGVALDQLTPTVFARHTLSVRIAGESFVRAVQSANDDGSLSFYCAVERGIVLRRNQHLDIPQALDLLLSRIDERLGEQQLILGFDCIFRQLELRTLNKLSRVSDRLSYHPVVGFNTYGEHVNGIHLNATFTGVAIGLGQKKSAEL